jgi:hypothetical protein
VTALLAGFGVAVPTGSKDSSARLASQAVPAPSVAGGGPAVDAAKAVAGATGNGSRAAGARPATGDARHAAAARKLGLPANGPDFMYQPPPNLPQLQNRDPSFRASPLMVSGTERYVDGEYQYTDFVYDDDSAAYPDGARRDSPLWKRYRGNAADLFEFRLSTRGEDLAARFTLNTLMERDSTIMTVAFDSDGSTKTGSSTLPRDPGMPFPGTDQVLTTWGTGAEWSRWSGSRWVTVPLQVTTDLEANQVTVLVPTAVARPTGRWRATLATGLYDPKTRGWLDLASASPGGLPLPADTSAPNIVNLGFRFNEVARPSKEGVSLTQMVDKDPDEPPNWAPWNKQNAALAAGNPTQFANLIDFDLLRARGARDNVPEKGLMFRVLASRMKTVLAAGDANPVDGNPELLGEGKDSGSLNAIMLSPLSPYALYVPSGYQPDRPAPFTFFLKCDGCQYYDLGSGGTTATLGESRNSLVVMPSARGKSGFYVGHLEVDVLESWADVARHFTLDPTRPSISGGSGGGGGAYRVSLLWPHLFARTAPLVPPMCRGLWTGVYCTGGAETVLANWAENARNLPIFHVADAASELTFYPGTVQLVHGLPNDGFNSFDELGYRYRLWSLATDHVGAALVNAAPVVAWLGQHQIEPEPFHVTYVRMPSNDVPEVGLVHNRAYWLSGIELRDKTKAAEGRLPCTTRHGEPCAPLGRGVIDAVSLGFGKSDPTSKLYVQPGLANGYVPTAYTETQRVWSDPGKVPVQDRIVIKAKNIGAITIDPAAARVSCNVKLDIQSDGPVKVNLIGCPR